MNTAPDRAPAKPQRRARAKAGREAKTKAPAKPVRGRPVGSGFHPTEEQRAMIRLAAAYRVPEDEMRLAILNPATGKPISEITLRKHFRDEIDEGYVDGKMRVMAASFHSATGIKDKDGKYILAPNVTAQIWLQKTLYGFRENVAVALPAAAKLGEGHDEVTLDGARRVAFALALGAEITDKKATKKPGKG